MSHLNIIFSFYSWVKIKYDTILREWCATVKLSLIIPDKRADHNEWVVSDIFFTVLCISVGPRPNGLEARVIIKISTNPCIFCVLGLF